MDDNDYSDLQPIPKHLTRNPVDINLIQANAVSAIGRANEANKEAKRQAGSAENDNIQLRSALATLNRLAADQVVEITNLNKEVMTLEALVNEMRKRIFGLCLWLFILAIVCLLLFFML